MTTFDLSLSESAGSRSLDRLVGYPVFGTIRSTFQAQPNNNGAHDGGKT